MDISIPTEPVFKIIRPDGPAMPIIVASPHSGRCYGLEFRESSRLDGISLRKSEDSFVDELFADAPRFGAPLLAATFPRAYCDVNREAWELDPAMFEDKLPAHVNSASPRVAAGLGTIARVVASGEPIYRRKLRFAEAQWRIENCWAPYHRALAGLVAETQLRFGGCLLLDCHSMPGAGTGAAASGFRRSLDHGPDIVLGDAHGTSCARPITGFIETTLRGSGFIVRRNEPYAGGFVTRHYGRPREHVHVLQIEILRPLYMDENRIEKHQGFNPMRAAMAGLLSRLSDGVADFL